MFDDVNTPNTLQQQIIATRKINYNSIIASLLPREKSSHKGWYGHVLCVGGDTGYAGAIRLAGEAAARAGAGLISLGTREAHIAAIVQARPELMAHALQQSDDLDKLLERATVIAIGPGLGTREWGERWFSLVCESSLPLVVDADGLNILAKQPCHRDNWVLTPHPGEAARLMLCSVADIEQNRFAATIALQKKYGGVVVLKGAGSCILGRGNHRTLAVCTDGNPGMASGGMGDVLTGVIASFIAQGLDLSGAAELGVCVHSRAADIAAQQGERGLLASDLMTPIRSLVNP